MWTFRIPTTIVFGEGSIEKLAEVVAPFGSPGVLAVDPALATGPAADRVRSLLPNPTVFSDIVSNPTIDNVDALASVIRACGARYVAALGGGSVMDCAKAAAALAAEAQPSIRPYHGGARTLSVASQPLVAIPTTAGTGAEVTPIAVLDDPVTGRKAPLAHPHLYPSVAVVDPLLTLGLPKPVTASSGLDALAHAVEGYWSKNHQPLCDALAIEAARTVLDNLARVLRSPGDREARSAMAYAALTAGMAFQLPKNAMVHACSYPLSQRYHLAHGAACALTLPEAIELNAPAMGERMTRFAQGAGCRDAAELARRVRDLRSLGGLPSTLAQAGVPRGELDTLVEASFHPLMNNNPLTVTPHILRDMYERMYQ